VARAKTKEPKVRKEKKEKKTPKYILSLDSSTKCIGWAIIINDAHLKCSKSGVIKEGGTKVQERIFRNTEVFVELLTAIKNKYDPGDFVAVFEEAIYKCKDKKGVFALGAAQGALWLELKRFGIEIDFIAISTWRKLLVSKGSANKFETRKALIADYGFEPSLEPKDPDDKDDLAYDESDAVGVGTAYAKGL